MNTAERTREIKFSGHPQIQGRLQAENLPSHRGNLRLLRSVCVPGEVGYPYAIVIFKLFFNFWVIRDDRVTH